MDPSNRLNILKNAFLMERQGKALYETARDTAENPSVKKFFQSLAEEEKEHMDILEKQFRACMEEGKFTVSGFGEKGDAAPAPEILSDEVKNNINAAGFEATAITAAIAFEKNAVELYSARAKETSDPEEEKLYKWLATWETTHLKNLLDLQDAVIGKIWDDNSFWPF